MRTIFGLLAVILASTVLHAQTQLPRVDVQVEVEVVEIDVVVTDRRGNAIQGLRAEDFTVLENGKAQTITNLIEVRDEALSEGESQIVRPTHIVVFFDALTTSTQSRTKAVRALEPLMRQIRPIDEVMVVLWNRTLDIVVAPTNDAAKIAAGLEKVPWPASRGMREENVMGLSDTLAGTDLSEAGVLERALEIRAAQDAVSTTKVVQSLVSRLAGAEGRKVFFLISDGLELERAIAVQQSDLPREMPKHRSENFDDRARHGRQILEEVATAANASGVTFYTMKPAGLVAPSTTAPDGALLGPIAFDAAAGTLIQLAERTGGRFVTRTNDLAGGVGRIVRELTNYYSIAYQPPTDGKSSKSRKLVVHTRNADHVVRARRSVSQVSRDTQLAQQIVSNAFFPLSHNDLNVSLVSKPAKRVTRNRMNVALDVVVPYSTLAFVSAGDGYEANLTLYVATVDERENVSEVKRFDRRVTVTRARFANLAKDKYVYGFDLSLEAIGAKNRVTIGVVDQLTKITGFAVAEVTAPPLGRK